MGVLIPFYVSLLVHSFLRYKSLFEFLKNFLFLFPVSFGFIWTFIEYYTHRFKLHKEQQITKDEPENPERNARIFESHLHHHVFMNQKFRIAQDLDRYAISTPISYLLLSIFLNIEKVNIIVSGIGLGSLVYDMLHYYFHHGSVPPFKFL